MATVMKDNQVFDWIIDILNTALWTSMSLKMIQRGGLSFYPAIEDISSDCPAIIIKKGNVDITPTGDNVNFTITYNLRLIFIDQYTETTEVVEAFIDKVNTILETLWDNQNMPTYSASNVAVSQFYPISVEYDCPENAQMEGLNKKLMAAAINTQAILITNVM